MGRGGRQGTGEGSPDGSRGVALAEPSEKVDPSKEIETLAASFHDDWRASRLRPDGTFEPRIKETKDKTWIREQGTNEVDIANTPYTDLPADWQAENKAAAEAASEAVESSETVEGAASLVHHDAWLERNGDWAEEDQKLPYAQLREEEKAKDREQVQALLKISKRFTEGEDGTIIPQR